MFVYFNTPPPLEAVRFGSADLEIACEEWTYIFVKKWWKPAGNPRKFYQNSDGGNLSRATNIFDNAQ